MNSRRRQLPPLFLLRRSPSAACPFAALPRAWTRGHTRGRLSEDAVKAVTSPSPIKAKRRPPCSSFSSSRHRRRAPVRRRFLCHRSPSIKLIVHAAPPRTFTSVEPLVLPLAIGITPAPVAAAAVHHGRRELLAVVNRLGLFSRSLFICAVLFVVPLCS